jgi:hypothetical protein
MFGAALCVTACTSSAGSSSGADSGAVQSTAAETSAADTTTPTGSTSVVTTQAGADTTPAPATTFPVVRTRVVGSAVGGNSGGEGPGQTDSFSEAVRNADGTCSGWEGPGGAWTQGLVSGAPVVFLDRETNAQIGTGQLGTSAWSDADPGDGEQWNCVFPFTGELDGNPATFKIKVGDLAPWVVLADPTAPGQFVTSVNTVPDPKYFGSCTEPDQTLTAVSEWSSVGQFWSLGFPSLCSSGLVIATLDRPCRPPGFASDYIMSVANAADPSIVYEDATGLLVDPATIPVFTPVVVSIAIGRPCG